MPHKEHILSEKLPGPADQSSLPGVVLVPKVKY